MNYVDLVFVPTALCRTVGAFVTLIFNPALTHWAFMCRPPAFLSGLGLVLNINFLKLMTLLVGIRCTFIAIRLLFLALSDKATDRDGTLYLTKPVPYKV